MRTALKSQHSGGRGRWEFEASHTVRRLFLAYPRQRSSWKAREETSPQQLEEAVGEGGDSEG